MATYKRGYKKESAEQALLKVIVGILVSVLIIVAIAWGYHQITKWKDYDNYTIITDYDDIVDNSAVTDGNYVVYLYAPTNTNCISIKNSVLRAGNKINRDSEMFFVADTTNMNSTGNDANDKDEFIAATDQTDVFTPSIVVFVDGDFYAAYSQQATILSTLESIQDGTYAPFN